MLTWISVLYFRCLVNQVFYFNRAATMHLFMSVSCWAGLYCADPLSLFRHRFELWNKYRFTCDRRCQVVLHTRSYVARMTHMKHYYLANHSLMRLKHSARWKSGKPTLQFCTPYLATYLLNGWFCGQNMLRTLTLTHNDRNLFRFQLLATPA